MTFDPYPQKRLACFACRDKKLRCNTVTGDICQRCRSRSLDCIRPQSKRDASNSTHVNSYTPIRSSVEKESIWNSTYESKPKGNVPSSSSSSSTSAILTSPLEILHSTQPETIVQNDLLPIESAKRLFWSTLDSRKSSRDCFTFCCYPDQSTALDPIVRGILSLQEAQDLFHQFMQTFGRTLAYFDSDLATFSYIRSRSHALISVICHTMSRSQKGKESLAAALCNHVHHVVLPAILLQNFKSVEIVQALMMLAAFEPPTDSIREDRSWTLLSHASRIGGEINMQASFECDTNQRSASERVIRERRNAQRTWINVWLHEFSLAQHTGRKSVLAEQDIFAVCKNWHRHPLACYTDTALVSMVELRTIIKRNRQLFHRLPPNGELFYVEQCKSDLDAWSRAWCTTGESSSSMPRLELASLYVSHAMVQLLGLVLHNIPPSQWMSSMILDLYESSSTYLDAFPVRLPPQKLIYCYNSMFVAASYESIVAIRLTQLASRFTFIDVNAMRSRCHRVWKCLSEAANLSSKDTAANCYARFMEGVLRTPTMQEEPAKQTKGATRQDERQQQQQHSSDTTAGFYASLDSSLQGEMATEKGASANPQDTNMPTDIHSTLGFDDLQFFAWAGASLAQHDSFFAQLFGDARTQ